MFTLLGEVNLWTFDDNITIKDFDFGAFRYHDKRFDNLYEEGKRSYCQRRGMIYVPTNKKGNKLKDSIKYLEDQLKDNSTVFCQWYDHCTIQIMLSNGLLIQIQVNITTGDIQKIMFDKYLVGKVSDHITDVAITKNHLICTYNDHQVTLIHFTKSKRHVFDKISKLEPKISTIDLFGVSGRRLDKRIQVNKSGNLVLIWWKSTMNEVYPWSPTVKEHDRANIHLYRLTGAKLDLICYLRTEFDPLCITFDASHDNIIHSVEQKVSRKGEVTIEWRTYEVSHHDKLQRIAVISVPLPTHTSCIRFSPNQELLLLCCIDGSVMLYDQVKATNTSIKAAFIPTLASWHSDGIIFAISNDRGQFQHFDISLSCIKYQTLSEDATPANILDLSSYFRNQPALSCMEWNKKSDPSSYVNYYNHGDSLFLLLFERGPVGVIKVIEGDDLSGDVLVRRYLSLSQVEQATSLLLSMNWDTYPRVCMHSLNQILNYLFKLPLTSERENLIQNALGSFHVPVTPISQATEEEYGDEVRDLTRRFFHHLLRYRMFEKAFRLAIDLNDHDLFMDIHFYALVLNDKEMANAAKEKAEQILSRSNSCSSSHSRCSRTSCSLCSDSTSDKGEESYSESEESTKEDAECFKRSKQDAYLKKCPSSQIPPLPVLHPHSNSKSLLPASFDNDPPINKTDYNLMSTSFNTPNSTLASTTFNHSSHISISNTFFASTSFSKPTYKSHSNEMSVSTINAGISQPFSSISNDLMTTAFGNFSLNDPQLTIANQESHSFIETNVTKPLTNDIEYSFNGTASSIIAVRAEDNAVMSTPFNDLVYESASADVASNRLMSSLDNTDSNIMSTSFSTLVPNVPMTGNNFASNQTSNSKSESTTSSPLRTQKLSDTSTVIADAHNDVNRFIPTFYNSSKNLLSTSFMCPEDRNMSETDTITFNNDSKKSDKKHTIDVPPPPSLTNSLANYLQNLPRKNVPLSWSTPGLTDIDESIRKCTISRTTKAATHVLQRQNSTSSIQQNQQRHTSILPSRTYRLNYDLDYIPYHGSCDNIDVEHNRMNSTKFGSMGALHHFPTYNVQNKLIENRQLRLGSPQHRVNVNPNKETKMSSNIPPLPVISSSNSKPSPSCPTFVESPISSNEKPKVKFSDTVTHILVPGTGQAHRQKRSLASQLHVTDPKRELAESLPLCLGNEDYLKDFQPLSKDNDTDKAKESAKADESAKIKVVHFGLL